MDGLEVFKFFASGLMFPFAFYVMGQINKSKEDRMRLKEELHQLQIYCERKFAEKRDLEKIRLEIKSDLIEFKREFLEIIKSNNEINQKILNEVQRK